jgi:hypothetical protein
MIRVRGRKPLRDWSQVDWSKTTGELAQEFGMRDTSISILRRKHAPHTVNRDKSKSRIKYHVDWTKVQWTKRNVDLAGELKVPVGTVQQKRRKLAPDTIKRRVFQNINK